jgi:hypothetical protein
MLRKFMLVSVLLIALTAAADVQASKDREHGNNIHRSVETPSLAEVDHAITLAASYLEQSLWSRRKVCISSKYQVWATGAHL